MRADSDRLCFKELVELVDIPPQPMPPLPLLWLTCLSQKQAVDEFNTPNNPKWSSTVASAGTLITGAVRLNTFPPRSNTKWLCVATNANAIDNGEAPTSTGN